MTVDGYRTLVVPPEPTRPAAVLDRDGDLWARGDDGWWPAFDQQWTTRLGSGREVYLYDRPWTWLELNACLGDLTVVALPAPSPDPTEYTGELPAADPSAS